MNNGSASTCVRPQGSFIINLTWASVGICRDVSDWRVLSDVVSLSDHMYITFSYKNVIGAQRLVNYKRYPQWNVKNLDRDLFKESLTWLCKDELGNDFVDSLSARLTGLMISACDRAKRLGIRCKKRGVYWWNDSVAPGNAVQSHSSQDQSAAVIIGMIWNSCTALLEGHCAIR